MSTNPKTEIAVQDDMGAEVTRLMDAMGVLAEDYSKGELKSYSPINGQEIGSVQLTSVAQAEALIGKAHEAFRIWRNVPAPRRGELVRLLGEELRASKAELGRLISIEVGKIESEGLGEVQERSTSATLPSGCRASYTG